MTTEAFGHAAPAPSGEAARATDGQHVVVVRSGATGAGEPAATRGRTSIADSVVEKIAGVAAREVPGVYSLGTAGLGRALSGMRERVPGGHVDVARGVDVEVGERQAAVDLDLVVAYGEAVHEVAAEVRENVIVSLERMTGLEVVEVNIAVDDVHMPEGEGAAASEEAGRVQ